MAAEAGGAAAAVSAAARAVMVGPAVTGEIVSGGLAGRDARLNAAKCLAPSRADLAAARVSRSPLASAAAGALLPWLRGSVGPGRRRRGTGGVGGGSGGGSTAPSRVDPLGPSSADFSPFPRRRAAAAGLARHGYGRRHPRNRRGGGRGCFN